MMSLTTALAGSAQIASASSSAQAEIDWNNLTITYVDLSNGLNAPSLNWTYQLGDSHSDANSFDPFDSTSRSRKAYNFTSSLSTDTSTDYAQSSTLRNSNTLTATAASQTSNSPFASPWGPDQNVASASVFNQGNFEMFGYGVALIILDWSYSGNSDSSDSSATSGINITGNYSDNNGSSTTVSSNYNDYANPYWNAQYDHAGIFMMSIFGDGVHTVLGSLTAQAWANSASVVSPTDGGGNTAVPLPAASWMFGSGLLGLLGFSRRKPTVA